MNAKDYEFNCDCCKARRIRRSNGRKRLTKAHVAATARLYGSGERWPSVTQEAWLAKRLGYLTYDEGVTTAEERRERLRRRIVESGRAGEHIGRSAVDGTELTFAATFERLYGVPL